jgi:hypothetical protein
MKNFVVVSALALAAGLAATPAAANEKQDFATCDGRIHPARPNDGMRGEASPPRWAGVANAKGAILACDRALGSSRLLPTQTLRRAHLLRARAVKKIEVGRATEALADLDLAAKAAPERAGDRFYARSMGVSLDLLRAMALVSANGDLGEARRLATAAMAARPYSLQVQRLGAEILHSAGAAEASPFAAPMKLQPAMATTLLMREANAGNYKAVIALRPELTLTWPDPVPNILSLLTRQGSGAQFLSNMMVTLETAYARAATGDPAGARKDLQEVRTRLAALSAAPEKGVVSEYAKQTSAQIGRGVDLYARQIEARIAVAEGRHSDALAALVGEALPKDAMSAELISALRASVPAKDAALVPAGETFVAGAAKERTDSLVRLADLALIAPETPRSVVDYSRARPNILGALIGGALTMGTSLLGGISRTDGFRSSENADGTTKVEFVGNTPSAALVGEMTLLRAAEIAREKGKATFLVTDRNDYQRMLVSTQYGIEQSRTPQGYKTELTIRLLDSAAGHARALDATAVIDALGPFYYEERAPARKS